MKLKPLLSSLALAAVLLAPAATAVADPAGSTLLVSRPSGLAALPDPAVNHASGLSSAANSADGCRTVFTSIADGLATDDDDRVQNAYVRDRCTPGGPTTTLVSRADGDGAGANGNVEEAVISADGGTVAFSSHATNLDPAHTQPGRRHVYVRDLESGETQLASRATGATGAAGNGESRDPALDDDGSTIAFETAATNLAPLDANGKRDIVVRELSGGFPTMIVSRTPGNATGNGDSTMPDLDADGGTVAFATAATDLVAGDGNGHQDIAVRTISSGATVLASRGDGPGDPLGDGWSFGPALSADATRVVFTSSAKNLPGAINGGPQFNVWVRDLTTDTTILASRSTAAANRTAHNGGISADGTRVAFSTDATNLPGGPELDVYVRDLAADTLTLVSRASGPDGAFGTDDSGGASITADGEHVAFLSDADELVPDDADDFRAVHERDLAGDQATRLVSRPTGTAALGGTVNQSSIERGAVSADGRYVAFTSGSDVLAGGGGNGTVRHVFVRDVLSDTTIRISRGLGGAAPDGDSGEAVISGDGRRVAFVSSATNLVAGDTNRNDDVFVATIGEGGAVTIQRGSLNGAGAQIEGGYAPALSADGTRLAFLTWEQLGGDADATPDGFVRDLVSGAVTLATPGTAESVRALRLDGDGSRMLFHTGEGLAGDDANDDEDVYLRDLSAATTSLVARSADGAPAEYGSNEGTISADGRHVAFSTASQNLGPSFATSLNMIVRKDLDTGAVVLASRSDGDGAFEPDGRAFNPAISADGRSVSFSADAGNLDAGDGDSVVDVFVRDVEAQQTVLATVGTGGAKGTAPAYESALSGNGRCVAFMTTGDLGDGYGGGDFDQVHLRAIGDCPASDGDGDGDGDGGGAGDGDGDDGERPAAPAGTEQPPAALPLPAPPGGGPTPPRVTPGTPPVAMRVTSKRLRRLSRGRALGVAVRCVSDRCAGTLTLTLRGRRIGRARFAVGRGAATIRVPLGAAARRALKGAPRAKVRVVLAVPGAPVIRATLRAG